MELILDHPGDSLFIRSVTADGIRVGDAFFHNPVILSAEKVIPDWPVTALEQLKEEHLEELLELRPDVVLIGTGAKQEFLDPKQLMLFYSRNIGVEVMTTHAACRTFNVLVSESRNVAAILMPI
jgi:uncharacterized protein